MEVYVLLGLVGLGYLFSSKNNSAAPAIAPSDMERDLPLRRRYLPGKTHEEVRHEEMLRAQDAERAARFPMRTGAVDQRHRMGTGPVTSHLAGVEFSEEDFRHDNMQPFFGGSMTAAREDADSGMILERFAGAPGVANSRPKAEVAPMFAPEEYVSFGGPGGAQTEDLQSRIADLGSVNRVQNNELPFEQVKVGPGVGQGYGSAGAGGFGHNEDRDYAIARYKTVDELRPGNNPKAELEGRVNPGADRAGRRGLVGQTAKNKPDTAFDIGDFGLVPTSGIPGQAVRPDPVHGRPLRDPPTAFRLEGGAGVTRAYAPEGAASRITDPRLPQTPLEPLGAARAGAGSAAAEDLVRLPEQMARNERSDSHARWDSVSRINAGSAFPAAADVRTHLYPDPLRQTAKDLSLDTASSHAFGSVNPQAPPRGPAYDPVLHRPRTTMKEVGINGEYQPANYSNEQGQAADAGTSTRRTVREGFGDTYGDYSLRNVDHPMVHQGIGSSGADPRQQQLQPSSKELTQQHGYLGGVAPGDFAPQGGYDVAAMGKEEARATNRQFTDLAERMGGPGMELGGHAPTKLLMENSLTTSNNRVTGPSQHFAGSKHPTGAATDYASVYAATVNEAKQSLLAGRAPGGHGGAKRAPHAALQGDVHTRDIVYSQDYLNNPGGMPKERGGVGSLSVQANTGLSHDDRIDEGLLDWLNSNPLVTSPVSKRHQGMAATH